MKNLYHVFLIAAVCLTSCAGSKKFSRIIDENLQVSTLDSTNIINPDWLSINTDSLETRQGYVKQLNHSFIPALIYWGWNSTIETEIKQEVTIGYLTNSIQKAADSLHLSEKLKGSKLVVKLKRVPGKFVYENKGAVLYLLLAYSATGSETITPAPTTLEASFEVQTGDRLVSSGTVYFRQDDEPVSNGLKSTKKFTRSYLDHYRKDTEQMGTELVSQIIEKMNTGTSFSNN